MKTCQKSNVAVVNNASVRVSEQASTVDTHQLTLAELLAKTVSILDNQRLSDESVATAQPYLHAIGEIMHLTDNESMMFALFMERHIDSEIHMPDIAKILNCSNVSLLTFEDDIQTLRQRRILRYNQRQNSYRVPMSVVTAVKQNHDYIPQSTKDLTPTALFEQIGRLLGYVASTEMPLAMAVEELKTLMQDNPQSRFVHAVEKLRIHKLDNLNFILFFAACDMRVKSPTSDTFTWYDVRSIFRDFPFAEAILMQNNNVLQTLNILEFANEAGMRSRTELRLSPQVQKQLFEECNICVGTSMGQRKDIIKAADIVEKALFYNACEAAQISQLTELLRPERFAQVQADLKRSGMRTGFVCLFYGAPGTGKTETAYQLARATGRNLMVVDVSQLKSMWVGESEQNVQQIFSSYGELCHNAEVAPILLFNEADAVLGIRSEGATREVDRMENSIQNIILQGMERLNGIMIATTNLTQNLDKAFDRRFLYKIKFGRPSPQIKQKIWQSMMPTLSSEMAMQLARCYDFSGGQIENIARKRTVQMVISGAEPTAEELDAFCRAEQISRSTEYHKIGF